MVKFNQAILSEIQRFLVDAETEKQKWHRSLKLGLDFCAARRCILAGFEYTLGKSISLPGRACRRFKQIFAQIVDSRRVAVAKASLNPEKMNNNSAT
ncbi:hypothetical protein ACHELR_003658 [Vibrio fluvialis]